MEIADILALYTQEQRIDIEFPGMRKDSFPNLVRFTRPKPGMSEVAYSRLDETNADEIIQAQVDYFKQLNASFTWKVYQNDTPSDLKDRLQQHGLAGPYEPDAIMVLDLLEAPAALLSPVDIDIRPITTPKLLSDVIRIMTEVWGGNFDWIRPRIGSHLKIPGYIKVYVAYVADQPACAGWIYFPQGQFASLWGGSTLPQYRKRGLYTALLAVRVQEAIRRGYRFVTIDAGAMSRPIVTSHGFRLLATAEDWEWEPEKPAQAE
jgi:GNAT superfamily N-acetyltransferase